MQKSIITFFLTALAFSFSVFGQDEESSPKPASSAKPAAVAPKPDVADGKYGEFAANTFDLWKPK
jgi:hypothetical protein